MRTVTPEADDLSARISAATPPHNVRPWPLPVCESPRVNAWRQQLMACRSQQERDACEASIAKQLEDEGTPIWEEDCSQWSRVSFISIQDAPHGVALQLNRMADPIDVADTLLTPLADSRVHALTLRVPHGWMGSYLFVPLPAPPKLVLHKGVDLEAVRPLMAAVRADPFAREHIHNKFAPTRSVAPQLAVARAPGAPDTALWCDSPLAVQQLEPVVSAVNEKPLPLSVWSHHLTHGTSPVIVLTDGEVWREQQPILAELTRRIDADECVPVHVIFLDSAGSRQRQLDYASTPEESSQLLDSIRARVGEGVGDGVGDGPWIVAGQSLGGLFAMLSATRHPDRVAAAIAQSPSLWWPAAPPQQHATGWFEERAVTDSGAPILLEGGVYDWLLIERTRDAAALLRAQRSLIDYHEHAAGHDVLQWQATLPAAISHTITHLAKG